MDDAPTGLSVPTLVAGQTGVVQNLPGAFTIDMVPAGMSVSIEVEATIDATFMGTSLINDAEITGGSDVDGGPDATDIDSTPGDDATPNDTANDNDTADTMGGDDQDPAVIPVEQVFDLALTKVINTTATSGPYAPGDPVQFTITVINQGTLDAFDVDVMDDAPTGLSVPTLLGGQIGVVQNTPGSFTIDLIPAGTSSTFEIEGTIDAGFMGVSLINDAEITGGSDVDGGPDATDIDSTPGNDATPDDIGNDNDTADTMGGDDQDPAVVPIGQAFDLALTKIINTTATPGPYAPGVPVQFTITVFNQGTLDAFDVDVMDDAPTGLSVPTLVAGQTGVSQNLPGDFTIDLVPAGMSVSIEVEATIDAGFTGASLINDAEIAGGSDVDGGPDAIDLDSTPGDDATPEDTANDNDTADTMGGDDQDPAVVPIVQTFDLALTKVINTTATSGPYLPGDRVQFTISVVNQGTTPAFDIDVIDTPPLGLSTPTLVSGQIGVAQNAPGNFTLDFVGLGMTSTFEVEATIDAGFMGASLINNAEITGGSTTDGGPDATDVDSTPGDNATPDDLGNDDDTADTAGGDDQDPALIPIDQVYDLALTKMVNTTATPGPYAPGDPVQYTITIFNQGTLDAFDVDVVDSPPVGLSIPMLVPGQTGVSESSPSNFTVDFVSSGSTMSFEVVGTIDLDFTGTSLINDAEITGGSITDGGPDATDIDSTPGNDSTPDDLPNDNNTGDVTGGDDQDGASISVVVCTPSIGMCPLNFSTTFNTSNGCIAPGLTFSQIVAQTGLEAEECGLPGIIDVFFTDELVLENCDGTSFDERTVIRTYNFVNTSTGEILNSCPQEITYEIDDCRPLSSFGVVGVDGESSVNVPEGCDLPTITVTQEEQGVCGYVEYMWLVSTTTDLAGNPIIPRPSNLGTTWFILLGENGPTLNPGVIDQTTFYVRCARNFSCCGFGESNIVSFIIDPFAACPVDILPRPNTLQDCDKKIVLVSPSHDFKLGEYMRFVSNEEGQIRNRISNNSRLELDMKSGVELQANFEVNPGAVLEVFLDGCQE